jgi:hypothetical protein
MRQLYISPALFLATCDPAVPVPDTVAGALAQLDEHPACNGDRCCSACRRASQVCLAWRGKCAEDQRSRSRERWTLENPEAHAEERAAMAGIAAARGGY